MRVAQSRSLAVYRSNDSHWQKRPGFFHNPRVEIEGGVKGYVSSVLQSVPLVSINQMIPVSKEKGTMIKYKGEYWSKFACTYSDDIFTQILI